MTELVGSSDGDFESTSGSNIYGYDYDGTLVPNSQTSNNISDNQPNRRLYNPLSVFASYTYNISLYMITPEAYDAFIQTGRKNINAFQSSAGGANNEFAAGVYLIAQSGGINNETSRRAPGIEYDYYIDNLKIVSHTSGKATQTSTNTTEISFNIYEPYGFSFIQNLKRAQDSLQEYLQATNRPQKGLQNPTRQFFVLGLRFIGYDQNGNIVDTVQTGLNSDPSNDNGLYETFYDIVLTEFKFKLSGKIVVYNIKAQSLPSKEAFGVKRGLVDLGANFQAQNAYEAIDSLISKLNKDQENLVNQSPPGIGIADIYEVEYLSDMEARLKSAIFVTPADLQKYTWAGSGAKNTSESNEAVAVKAQPNKTTRSFSIQGTTPVLQAINQIISQSSYLQDALKVIYTTNLEPNPEKNAPDQVNPGSKQNVRWYNISAQISNAQWDDVRSDFALRIKYIISPYETPVIQNAYTNPGVKYYGPHKRYEYWFSGKNSEILNYEQNLNTAYFNVAMLPNSAGELGKGGATDIPQKANQRTSQPHLGKLDIGSEAQNAYLTNLFDPSAYANAKMTILGDPDFLIQDSEATQDVQAVYSKFYGPNGFQIKANGGQVFIEVDFKEAIDYDNSNGLLELNDKILFWKYPESISKLVKGVSYQVIKVESMMNSGKFTQLLTLNINTFGDVKEEPGNGREQPNAPGTNQSGTSTTNTTGLKSDPTPGDNAAGAGNVLNVITGTSPIDDDNPAAGGVLPGA